MCSCVWCKQMMDVTCNLDSPETMDAVKEGALAMDLNHPSVIKTIGYATRAARGQVLLARM